MLVSCGGRRTRVPGEKPSEQLLLNFEPTFQERISGFYEAGGGGGGGVSAGLSPCGSGEGVAC